MSDPSCPKLTPPSWTGCEAMPEGWEVRRLKFVATCNDEALPETTDPDYEIAYVDISCVDLVNGITTVETLPFEEAPSRARRIVRDGDSIISTVRTYLKAIAPIHEPPENMIVSTGFAVVRPLELIASRFLGYALQSTGFIGGVVANSTGVSYPAINPTTLVCLPVGYPADKKEQQQIAAFLDWKTGQIDALMARKKELLEKLKEKRLAVITQAVTRGLNPAAPLRDSGIPWLGNVPAHWEVKRFSYFSRVVRGASPRPAGDPTFFNGDFMPWITVGEITRDEQLYLETTETMLTEEGASNSRTMRSGTLVLTNSGATLGVPKILSITGCANDGVVAFEDLAHDGHKEFLYYFLRSQTEGLRERMKQGGGQPNLNTDIIKALAVPFPPLVEQAQIAEHLRSATDKIDRMAGKVTKAIALLTEYRTALITAATTGKIDVRKVKIPNPA